MEAFCESIFSSSVAFLISEASQKLISFKGTGKKNRNQARRV
jgi:hypothetical protein